MWRGASATMGEERISSDTTRRESQEGEGGKGGREKRTKEAPLQPIQRPDLPIRINHHWALRFPFKLAIHRPQRSDHPVVVLEVAVGGLGGGEGGTGEVAGEEEEVGGGVVDLEEGGGAVGGGESLRARARARARGREGERRRVQYWDENKGAREREGKGSAPPSSAPPQGYYSTPPPSQTSLPFLRTDTNAPV